MAKVPAASIRRIGFNVCLEFMDGFVCLGVCCVFILFVQTVPRWLPLLRDRFLKSSKMKQRDERISKPTTIRRASGLLVEGGAKLALSSGSTFGLVTTSWVYAATTHGAFVLGHS